MANPLVFSASPDVAAEFVYLFSDALVRGFASVLFLTLGVAVDIRSCVAASLFFFQQMSAAATWCAALWAAALVYKFSDAFVHGFALMVSLALGEAYVIWFAAAASLFGCKQISSAAALVYQFSDASVLCFVLVFSFAFGEAYVIWFAAAASLFC